jgi:energy-coupling factor transport system ATP-binding protein
VQSTPATVIAASQFVDEIDDFDRVLFLEEGALVFDGTSTEFRSSEFMPSSLAVSSSATPSDGKVLLEARNLAFSYDNLTVVSDFSHQFKSGRVTAIMGPSGSGKTTLALLLAGLLKPQQGDVVSNAKTRIGVLLQFPEHNFFAETVFDEVAFAARNQGLAEEEVLQRVTGALTQVGLNYEEFYRRNPFTLSAGEQRRVAIAAVLVMDCSVYIFDEITCGLDWEGRQLVAGMLASLASAGKCLILCGHDRELAEALGAEVVEMGRAV